MISIPALEVGGSHVTATRVDPAGWRVRDDPPRSRPLDPHGSAADLVATIAACATSVGSFAGTGMCLAVPGPFDYDRGIAEYVDVGKFDALRGVDLRAALYEALPEWPEEISFVNDAAAFAAGEWVAGAGQDVTRMVGITLGTGVGSAFLDNGEVLQEGPGVPPQGRADLLRIDGRPLEETVSTRALIRVTGGTAGGVHDVVLAARAGDNVSQSALRNAYQKMGMALAPWVRDFRAEAMVVGGAIARSWDVIGPLVTGGLEAGGAKVDVRLAAHPRTAAHVGAVWLAGRTP
jgi:glucokinase